MNKVKDILAAAQRAYSPSGLFQLFWFVTARCNARCKMCFYLDQIEKAEDNLLNELTLSEIEKILTNLGYVPYISLSGGEPFLREDLGDILGIIGAKVKPLLISIPTNGAYTKRCVEVVKNFTASYPNTQIDIQLSVDGIGEDHDEIRQVPQLFDRVIETNHQLALLRKDLGNFGVKVVITASSFNQTKVEGLLDYVDQNFNFDRVIIAKVHGNCSPESKEGFDLSLFRRLCQKAEQVNSKINDKWTFATKLASGVKMAKEKYRHKFEKEQNLGRFCKAGTKIGVLSETGEMYPCEVLDAPLGNVRDYNYSITQLLKNNYSKLNDDFEIFKCHCDWGCAQNSAIATNIRFLPTLALKTLTKF